MRAQVPLRKCTRAVVFLLGVVATVVWTNRNNGTSLRGLALMEGAVVKSPTTGTATTSSPTTTAPTTSNRTTGAPTTASPTTGSLTTAAPTTASPTTGTPTTSSPTTGAPTTASPTEKAVVASAHPPPLLTEDRRLNCSSNIANLPRGWCLDEGHVPRYIGKKALQDSDNDDALMQEKYYTNEGFDQCLAGKTVVFVGDSRVRYQYLALLDFLKERQWMRCKDHALYDDFNKNSNTASSSSCFLIDHDAIPNHNGKDKDWNDWHIKTVAALSQLPNETTTKNHQQHDDTESNNFMEPTMSHLCDCYRPVPMKTKEAVEYRFVERTTQFGTTRLVYIQAFDQNGLNLDSSFPPFSSSWGNYDNKENDSGADAETGKKRCLPGYCKFRSSAFKGDVKSFLVDVLPKFGPTHVFANPGWEHIFSSSAQASFACELEELNRKHNHNPDTKFTFISHPPTQDKLNKDVFWDPSNPSNFPCSNVTVLDRTTMSHGVPKRWYWNGPHVLGILNEEYNHQMIKMICPLSST